MASTDTRASPYLQQTAKQLVSRDPKSWTYPLWAYVVGCIGVACICLFNGYVSALVEKRDVRKRTEKDLEAGILPQVPSDGTLPDYMAKGPHMHQHGSVIESERKTNLPTKMKRVFQKFDKGKATDVDSSVTAYDTSATDTTAKNSVGSQARGDWKDESKAPSVYRADEVHEDHIDHIAVSRPRGDPDEIMRANETVVDKRFEAADRK